MNITPATVKVLEHLRQTVPHLGERRLTRADLAALMEPAGLSWAKESSGRDGLPLTVPRSRGRSYLYLPPNVSPVDPPSAAEVAVCVKAVVLRLDPSPVAQVRNFDRGFRRSLRRVKEAPVQAKAAALLRAAESPGMHRMFMIAEAACMAAALPVEVLNAADEELTAAIHDLLRIRSWQVRPSMVLKTAEEALHVLTQR